MINSIIKILNKLKDIKKYSVKCDYFDNNKEYNSIFIPFNVISEIRYNKNGLDYGITIYKDKVIFRNNVGNHLTFEYTDEINKLEISKLAAIIYKNCLDNLTEQIKMFADEEIN